MNKPTLVATRTIYYELGMQLYMTETIKKPALHGLEILLNSKSSRVQKMKAAKVLWDAFQAAKCLPEPTKDNTWHHNTHNLIDLRDWLFARCYLDGLRMAFIRRIMNFVIILYDFDPPWRYIFDSVHEEAMKKDWKPRGWNDTWTDSYKWWKDADL